MEFKERYKEFSTVDDSRIHVALSDAANQISKKAWGVLYEQGLHALAAHHLYMNGALLRQGLTTGKPTSVVSSMSAGGLSTSYAMPDAGLGTNHNGLALSNYGIEYMRLLRSVAVGIVVVS